MEGERKKNKIMQLLEGAIISLTAGTHNEKKNVNHIFFMVLYYVSFIIYIFTKTAKRHSN